MLFVFAQRVLWSFSDLVAKFSLEVSFSPQTSLQFQLCTTFFFAIFTGAARWEIFPSLSKRVNTQCKLFCPRMPWLSNSDVNDRLISQSQSLYHFWNVFRFVLLRFLNGKFFNLWRHSVNKKFRQQAAWFSACIFAYVAFDTGSSRFQNFEYDNTTAGERRTLHLKQRIFCENIF